MDARQPGTQLHRHSHIKGLSAHAGDDKGQRASRKSAVVRPGSSDRLYTTCCYTPELTLCQADFLCLPRTPSMVRVVPTSAHWDMGKLPPRSAVSPATTQRSRATDAMPHVCPGRSASSAGPRRRRDLRELSPMRTRVRAYSWRPRQSATARQVRGRSAAEWQPGVTAASAQRPVNRCGPGSAGRAALALNCPGALKMQRFARATVQGVGDTVD